MSIGVKRDFKIDILKGLGIILVVCHHAGIKCTPIIVDFHMAIFFIASGYCFKDVNSETLRGVLLYIKKRILSLYVVFVGYNLFYILLRNQFIDFGIYTDNELFLEGIPGNSFGLLSKINKVELLNGIKEIFLFQGEQQMEGASWFLRALFSASVFYVLLDYVIKIIVRCFSFLSEEKKAKMEDGYRVVCAFICLYIGNEMGKHNIILRVGLHSMFVIYSLMVMGYMIHKYLKLKEAQLGVYFMIFCLGCILLSVLEPYASVNLNDSRVNSIIGFILASLLGWSVLYSASVLINDTYKIKRLFAYIGRNSIYVLMLHFISFKIVTLLQIIVLGYPRYALAAFPVMINSGLWCYIYIIVGVMVPMIVCMAYHSLKERIKEFIHR